MKKVFFFIFAGFLVFSFSCKEEHDSSYVKTSDLKKVSIGIPNNTVSYLLLIAKANGYFKEHGLNVEFKFYPSMDIAYKGMLAGEVNYSLVSGMSIARHGIKADAKIIINSCKSRRLVGVIVRTDKGIKTPEDLSGKTIGTEKNSALHYFLSKFIKAHQFKDCKIEFMSKNDLPKAMWDGEIDAFTTRNLFKNKDKVPLSGTTVDFFANTFHQHFVLTGRSTWLKKNPEISAKIISCLLQAERFQEQNYKDAIEQIAGNLPGDRLIEVKKDLSKYETHLGLCPHLMYTLEDQSAFLREDKDVETPDFIEMIYLEPIKTAAPARLTIMGGEYEN